MDEYGSELILGEAPRDAEKAHALPELNTRQIAVFQATLREYIDSAKPIGSNLLAQKYFSELSSATLRSTLNHLEEVGLLQQPHLSAGRVPTGLGFRYYLNMLLQPKNSAEEEKVEFISQWKIGKLGTLEKPAPAQTSELLSQMGRDLSQRSHQIALITSSRLAVSFIKQVELIRMASNRVLAVFISKNQLVEHRIFAWENAPSQTKLREISQYLTRFFQDLAGSISLGDIRASIAREISRLQKQCDHYLIEAVRILMSHLNQEFNIWVEGQSYLSEKPEFAGAEKKLCALLKAFENKNLLLHTLEKTGEFLKDRVEVLWGEDLHGEAFRELAFVVGRYGTPRENLGTLAVAGPRRMDYSRIVPLVSSAAEALNGIFNET